MFTIERSKT